MYRRDLQGHRGLKEQSRDREGWLRSVYESRLGVRLGLE